MLICMAVYKKWLVKLWSASFNPFRPATILVTEPGNANKAIHCHNIVQYVDGITSVELCTGQPRKYKYNCINGE